MKYSFLYFKSQWPHLIASGLFILVPYISVNLLMPKVPYTLYFFIIVLFLIKILVMDEKKVGRRYKKKIQAELTKELGKNPSQKMIFDRTQFYLKAGDITLLLTGIILVGLAIFLNRF